MPVGSETYTSKELCQRYGCAQITIRRRENESGFPKGEKFGRKLVYAKRAVHDWERKHMPHLQTAPDLDEEDKQWDRMHRLRQLEKEEASDNPPPKKRRKTH